MGSLTLDDFESSSRNMFKELLHNADFADVTLVSDDLKQIKAHKEILSASSSKFKAMFQQSHRQQESVIYLTGVSFMEMQSMIEFMYLGQTEIEQEDLEHFLEISEKLDVKGLPEVDRPPNNTKVTEDIEDDHLEIPNEKLTTKAGLKDKMAPLYSVEDDYEFKKEICKETSP